MVCASYTLSRAPAVIFAGMQHLPAIWDQVSAFVSPLNARAFCVLAGMFGRLMELLTARCSCVSIGFWSVCQQSITADRGFRGEDLDKSVWSMSWSATKPKKT